MWISGYLLVKRLKNLENKMMENLMQNSFSLPTISYPRIWVSKRGASAYGQRDNKSTHVFGSQIYFQRSKYGMVWYIRGTE